MHQTISPAKRDYLIKTLKAFRLLTEVYGLSYMRCCATSAMREASKSRSHSTTRRAGQ